jgi:hypothetical protein
MLLGRIAALDPKLAAQNAEQLMEKGQFPRTLSEVINQLSRQDPEAGAKLADKTVKRLQTANVLTNAEAATLAQSMLNAGIRQPATETASVNPLPPGVAARGPVLEQSAYVDLLSSVIDAALKVTLPPQNTQRPAAAVAPQRGRAQGGVAPQILPAPRPGQTTGPTEAQVEQMNARRLMAALMIAMPVVDQHLPSKSPALRQKFTEMGVGNLTNMGQPAPSFQGPPTSDSLIQAAARAPSPMQDRLYQQAAYRAIEEGNADKARQIAMDHLPEKSREILLERLQYREMVSKADTARLEEIRQTVSRLGTDNEKIDLLIQMAGDAQKTNKKLAVQLLEEARQITNRRAANYEQFNQQLRVARAFTSMDSARSFEVIEPMIGQINDLLAAAAILNGFEVNMFRDGEMTMQGGSSLTTTISRIGQELANLARTDFERSEVLAGRFQMTEPRIMTRLLIVQGLLNTRTQPPPPGVPLNIRMGNSIVSPE